MARAPMGTTPIFAAPQSGQPMTDFFFAIGHFIQWTLGIIEVAQWSIPVVIIVVLLSGMAYWLSIQRSLTRKAKDRGDFI